MNSLDALFSDIDDFCQNFEPRWYSHLIEGGSKTRRRAKSLCLREIITILITFHQHHYRILTSLKIFPKLNILAIAVLLIFVLTFCAV